MIQFEREGGKVKVIIAGKHPVTNWTWKFSYDCGTEAYAQLLEENFRQNLWETISKIRQKAYNEGWKHARSHKERKRDWFSGSMDLDA